MTSNTGIIYSNKGRYGEARESFDKALDLDPNNDNSACGRFSVFINQVNASERRGSLTAIQADDLRTQAEDIRDIFDC